MGSPEAELLFRKPKNGMDLDLNLRDTKRLANRREERFARFRVKTWSPITPESESLFEPDFIGKTISEGREELRDRRARRRRALEKEREAESRKAPIIEEVRRRDSNNNNNAPSSAVSSSSSSLKRPGGSSVRASAARGGIIPSDDDEARRGAAARLSGPPAEASPFGVEERMPGAGRAEIEGDAAEGDGGRAAMAKASKEETVESKVPVVVATPSGSSGGGEAWRDGRRSRLSPRAMLHKTARVMAGNWREDDAVVVEEPPRANGDDSGDVLDDVDMATTTTRRSTTHHRAANDVLREEPSSTGGALVGVRHRAKDLRGGATREELQVALSRTRSQREVLGLLTVDTLNRMDALHVAATVCRLGRLAPGPSFSSSLGNNKPLVGNANAEVTLRRLARDPQVVALLTRLSPLDLEDLDAAGLVGLLWGVVRLELRPTWLPELLRACGVRAEAFSFHHLSTTLFSALRLGNTEFAAEALGLVKRLHAAFRRDSMLGKIRQGRQGAELDVVCVTVALAKLQIRDEEALLPALAQGLQMHLGRESGLCVREVASAAAAFASLGYFHRGLFRAVRHWLGPRRLASPPQTIRRICRLR